MLIFIGWQGNDKPIFCWHGLKGKYKIIFLLLQIIMSVPSQECVPMVNVSIWMVVICVYVTLDL